MALLGTAALAMWWDMTAAMRDEFQHWHTHEHFPERLSVPGFLRASRWADAGGGEGFFVMYEVADFGVLTSAAYLAHLNAPTPWSTKLMPYHRNMVRSQCKVAESAGGGVAGHALTLRFGAGSEDAVGEWTGSAAEIAARPGVCGVHVLHAQRPAIAATTEQDIRGNADAVADWIVVVCGYEASVLAALGVPAPAIVRRHVLAASMTRGDVNAPTR